MHLPVHLLCLSGVSMLPAPRAAVGVARAYGVLTIAVCNHQQREEGRDTGKLIPVIGVLELVCLFIPHVL